jgi:hypothetical protein
VPKPVRIVIEVTPEHCMSTALTGKQIAQSLEIVVHDLPNVTTNGPIDQSVLAINAAINMMSVLIFVRIQKGR